GVHPGQLLDRDGESQEIGSLAPVRLGEWQPEQPHLAHLLDDVDRELLQPVHLLGPGSDDLFGEVPDGAPEFLLLRGQVEIHGGKVSCSPADRKARAMGQARSASASPTAAASCSASASALNHPARSSACRAWATAGPPPTFSGPMSAATSTVLVATKFGKPSSPTSPI